MIKNIKFTKSATLVAAIIALLGSCFLSVNAQEESSHVEIFGGYSLKRIKNELPETVTNLTGDFAEEHLHLNGFDLAVTGNINKYVGIAGEVTGHFKNGSAGYRIPCVPAGCTPGTFTGDISTRAFDFLAGPEFKVPNKSVVKPFVHTLAGVASDQTKSTNRAGGATLTETETKNSFSLALGGGLDVDVSKRFAIRLIQVDYNAAFPKNALGERHREDNLELSFGAVFKF